MAAARKDVAETIAQAITVLSRCEVMEAKERDSQAVPHTVVRRQGKTDGTLPPYTVQAKTVDRNVGGHR